MLVGALIVIPFAAIAVLSQGVVETIAQVMATENMKVGNMTNQASSSIFNNTS